MRTLPYIAEDAHGIRSLMVDGRPYMGLAGELKNSSSSSSEWMARKVWPALEPLGLDTVLLPIAWEMMEPEEGRFDFSLVDAVLGQARERGARLVLLWFGLWKNAESMYTPLWVKRDTGRFWLARHRFSGATLSISPLCREAVQADARAFGRLMAHLRETDGTAQTVIMVQVENEIGFLGSERDFSPAAEAAFLSDIPEALAAFFHTGGSWSQAFGEDAPEIFMAWHYAQAVEHITQAGKAAYNLPMYVNAWLEQHPCRPGRYPSGGPIARMMPVWKLGAPSVDLFAPDIYVSDFAGTCAEYAATDNPLLLPEVRRDPVTASNVFYAFGHHKAILYAPFGIDEFMDHQEYQPNTALLNHLNIDIESFNCAGTAPYLIPSYRLLREARPFLLAHRGQMQGFIKKSGHDRGCVLSAQACDLIVSYPDEGRGKPGSAGLWMELENDTFLFMGCRFWVEPVPKRNARRRIAVLRLEEGRFEQGEWVAGRVLNGDEKDLLRCGDTASCFKFTIGQV